MMHVFSADHQLLLREYQKLVAEHTESIVLFTKKIPFISDDGTFDEEFYDDPYFCDRHVAQFETKKRMMEELLEFIRTTDIAAVLQSVPVNTQQRVELLKPWLWSNHETEGFWAVHAFLDLPRSFTSLLLYPNSLRPVTDMSRFWNLYDVPTSSRRIETGDDRTFTTPIPNQQVGFLIETERLGIVRDRIYSIPVLRYVAAASHSLFYGNSVPTRDSYGTFFYYDPDSAANLISANTLFAINKTSAMGLLGMSLNQVVALYDKQFDRLYDAMFSILPPLYENLLGVSMKDLQRYSKERTQDVFFHRVIEVLYATTETNAKYLWELDSFEDTLDQQLCMRANAQGINAVILARMVGGSRLVSEVLHTGNNKEAFSNFWIRE